MRDDLIIFGVCAIFIGVAITIGAALYSALSYDYSICSCGGLNNPIAVVGGIVALIGLIVITIGRKR